jgi:hypothetical protein
MPDTRIPPELNPIMATTTSLTTTYAGELAGEICAKALQANVSTQYVTFKPNVPYKSVARKINDDVTFANGTCDFTPTGEIVLTERILTLEEFQVQRQICKKDFFTDWSTADVLSGRVNTQIQDAIIERMVSGIAANNETIMWSGVTANAGEYDGFETLISASSAVSAGSGTLDDTTIIGAIWSMINTAPTGVKGAAEKPIIYMGQAAWEAYMQAQIAAGNGWYLTGGPEVNKRFVGMYEIAVCPGMSADYMVFAQKSNLMLGTWQENQLNEVFVLDMQNLDGSQNVRYGARFYLGAQICVDTDITYWG